MDVQVAIDAIQKAESNYRDYAAVDMTNHKRSDMTNLISKLQARYPNMLITKNSEWDRKQRKRIQHIVMAW